MTGSHGRPDDEGTSVTFDLTPEEWVEVAWEHHRGTPLYEKTLRQQRVVFGLIVVTLALLVTLLGAPYLAVIWLLMGAIAGVLLPRQIEKSYLAQYRKFARDGIANGMFGTHRIRLTDEGLLDETDAYERLTRWHAIERVEDGAGSFLIYMGRNAFLPIPHSAFRDSETLRAFSDRFFEGLGGRDARHLEPPPRRPPQGRLQD